MKALDFVVSDKNIFLCFPCISQCKTCDPRAGPNLVDVHQMMLEHQNIQSLCLVVLNKMIYISQCKIRYPQVQFLL